ncbi:MAG: thiamine pyrophosphate-binding protein [Terriglobia bacterium]
MPSMTGSQYFAEALKACGITHVFFVPVVLTPALAELDRRGIVGVMTHGEKSAVYMADGYARASHRPGICMAQTVGAANLAAGLRDPYLACSPVIAITGGPDPRYRHRHVYQEIDDFPLFEPLTRFNARVDLVDRLSDLLGQAIRSATSGCPGPVHLEIAGHFGQASDSQSEFSLPFDSSFAHVPPLRPAADFQAVDQAARLLETAERPILVAGGGVVSSGAQQEVIELAERLEIPVATSLNAKGTIRENHPLSVGVPGTYSRACANRAIAEADLVFFVGSRTGSQVTNFWRIPRPGTRVIQLDLSPEELGRHYSNTVSLCGDARTVLRQILQTLGRRSSRRTWLQRIQELNTEWMSSVHSLRHSEASPMRPERICKELQEALPANAILVSETGHAGIWTGTHLELHHSTQTYMRAAGSLGWGLPAALGAKCACPNRPVICFSGDGGFYYHLGELETAVRYGINTVTIINNNRSLSQETLIFAQAYGGEQRSGFKMWQFEELNLARVAESLGCYAERVEQPAQIRPAFERALASGRPAVLDLVSDIRALAPDPWG